MTVVPYGDKYAVVDLDGWIHITGTREECLTYMGNYNGNS